MMLKIISGRSGSGKSVALRVLEDLGYYCVDNLPVDLLPAFIAGQRKETEKIAVSIDIRNMPADPQEISLTLSRLPKEIDTDIIYLDADNKELIRRFSETRRLHPLSRNQLSLEQAVQQEAVLLSPIKENADLVLDTSILSVHDLSETIRARVLGRKSRELVMVFESFGFKHGLPTDADYVYDVRFLPNPHWDPTLRPQTGLDEPVKVFLASQPEVGQLISQLTHFFEYWLPSLETNNRAYLTIAIGCTGGQHRSVYIAQLLHDYFRAKGHQVQVRHRTLELGL